LFFSPSFSVSFNSSFSFGHFLCATYLHLSFSQTYAPSLYYPFSSQSVHINLVKYFPSSAFPSVSLEGFLDFLVKEHLCPAGQTAFLSFSSFS
jgi:hypothetical protein